MEQGNVFYKDRERLRRGQVNSFNELPVDAQENFLNIKKFVIEQIGHELDVYIYGSYYWGLWDEKSDYDVIIHENVNTSNLDSLILEKLGLNANVLFKENKTSVILIP